MTDEQIIAYVDGELSPLDAMRFEQAMEDDAGLVAAVGKQRRLRETIAGRFGSVAAEPVPDRLRSMFGDDGKVVPFPQRVPPRPPVSRRPYLALAASLVAGLVLAQFLPRALSGPIEHRAGRMVAGGSLVRALDGQLASAQPANAVWRIGVSFRAGDGRYCRSFDGAPGAGLGCHDAQGWVLERFVTGARDERGAYRQAGSASAEISAAAQEMMAGAPLDATAEKHARDAGWAPAD